MSSPPRPLEIAVYQDLFCAWCYVAEARLELLRRELGDAVRWTWRPFALRLDEATLSEKERDDWMSELLAARREVEGARLSPDIWRGVDPPGSSVSALVALEAARLQGREPFLALMGALRRAALEQGVNISRSDVVLEIASALRLDMNHFVAAFQSPETRRLVREEYRLAYGRGVRGVPALVLGGRWMISGLREVDEYRTHILECLRKYAFRAAGPPDQLIH